ncbi:MAG: hypothetical protein ACW981_17255 [Candidatus Hodarchaeales archaeon]|jgi:hypothetical protein
MKKMFSTKITIVFLFFCLLMTVPVSQADSVSLKHDLDITYAHYADLDKDGLEDDIYVDFKLAIRCDDDDDNNYDYSQIKLDIDDDECNDDDRRAIKLEKDIHYDLKVELELPSGLERTYFFDFSVNILKEYKETVHLINNVTESGWYWARLALYFDGDYSQRLAYDSIYFDPPQATEGPPI